MELQMNLQMVIQLYNKDGQFSITSKKQGTVRDGHLHKLY